MTTIEPRPTTSPAYSGAALEWLHGLPSEPVRADLVTLDHDFAIRSIHELLENRPFDLPVVVNYAAGHSFYHFYFEARNREKVFGTKNLGIGYPFVLARLGGHEVAAPLFVWQFQIEPHASQPDQWQALRNDTHGTLPNYPLFHLVDALYGTDFSLRARSLAEGRTLQSQGLADFCEAFRRQLLLAEEGLPLSVQPGPYPLEAAQAMNEGRLSWSAVAGLFPTLPRTTLTDPPTVAPNLPADQTWEHTFTVLPLDPSQRAALLAAQRNALTVVEGASGSGKTYLISAIIINALANGKKVLVVSKSINALRRAQKFLLDKGIGDTSFIVRDLASDQLMLADMLRMTADNKNKAQYNEEVYKTLFNKMQREQRKLDEAWEELHAPLFGKQNFTELTGAYMRANRTAGKELLLARLNPADFDFTQHEYDDIKAAIYSSEPLFRRFPTLSHPLSRLSAAVFTDHDHVKGAEWTQQQVNALLEKSTALHHRFLTTTNDYNEALLDHYEAYYNELAGFIKRIRDGLEDGVVHFGSDFEKPVSTAEKLYGVFSDRYKEIVAAKEEIGSIFDEMRRIHGLRRYFEFDFPQQFDLKNIRKISELTRDFESAMRLWRRRIPANVREDVRRLNAKSIHHALDYREQIREMEQTMDTFLEEFNTAGLYATPLKHEMLTVPKRQEFLEEVIAQLEDTRFYLRDFDDFYIWQKHWLALQAPARKVVQALCKIKPDNWQAAFESWYLYHLLQNEFNPNLHWDDEVLNGYLSSARALRDLLPLHISNYWGQRKAKALKSLRTENMLSFKTWFGKNNRQLSATQKAEELFKKHIHPLTETLPVLLVTPQVALDVVQNAHITFDMVLVDEAHNIPKQECYHLFDLAKNLVVFGDSKQDMTPSAEDDILEFCKGIGAQVQHLDYQHQDSPEAWVQFNKVAFDTPFKRLPSGRDAQQATVVVNVEGRYDEQLCTNEAEARQIIDWLNVIEPTPAKTYPVVGIACATVQQRDLIASQLLRIRQRRAPGHEKIQQLHLSGMGVYQLSELQGQHVDILLLSLTHGVTDAQGALTQHLHFWNTQLGFNQLHVALTRATQKLFIAHSIPPGLHTVLAADKRHLGTCVLSHLVSFAEAIQNGEHHVADDQLVKMRGLLNYPDHTYPFSLFMEEVEIALRSYFDTLQMRRNTYAAEMRVPLFIEGRSSDEGSSILLFDGVLAPYSHPSYEWEEKIRHYFNKKQINAVPTYSTHWWRSPKQEARRLAGRLLRK
jgi:Rad3-related DNA helicase